MDVINVGAHWEVVVVDFPQRKCQVWEPLNFSASSSSVRQLRDLFGANSVDVVLTGFQKDGWSCGYVSVWLAMLAHQNIQSGAKTLGEVLRPVPMQKGWCALVAALIALVDSSGLRDERLISFLANLGVRRCVQDARFGNVDIPTAMALVEEHQKINSNCRRGSPKEAIPLLEGNSRDSICCVFGLFL
jgi:hypothetical protein